MLERYADDEFVQTRQNQWKEFDFHSGLQNVLYNVFSYLHKVKPLNKDTIWDFSVCPFG